MNTIGISEITLRKMLEQGTTGLLSDEQIRMIAARATALEGVAEPHAVPELIRATECAIATNHATESQKIALSLIEGEAHENADESKVVFLDPRDLALGLREAHKRALRRALRG